MKMDIAYIAKLSKLHLTDEQAKKLEQDMTAIVAMVEHLPEMDGSASLLDAENTMPLRPDTAEDFKFERDEMLRNAPATQAGCLVVPKTVE